MRFSILLLTGVIAASISSVEVSANPLFSRQTSMACSSCHFQHFPKLNGVGRSFKSAGYNLMGVQPKIEADDLSIPNTLNMAVVTTMGYEKSNQVGEQSPLRSTGDGVFYLPGSGGELSLFFGGRVSEIAGFLGELAVGGSRAEPHSSAKIPIEVSSALPSGLGGIRTSVVPFTTDALGASYGFELLNTGANIVQQMVGVRGFNGAHTSAFSAQQYLGTDGPATGTAFVISHPMGFVNFTKFNRTGLTNGEAANLSSTYLRVAGTFQVGSWDAALGGQMWSGRSAVADPVAFAAGTPLVMASTKATSLDAQMQGNMGELPVGFYASYATAPAVLDTCPAAVACSDMGNAFNTFYKGVDQAFRAGSETKSSLNLSTEVGVVPDKATLGAAIRFGKSGDGKADNALMLMGTYKLTRNMVASMSFTSASGSYWYSGTGPGALGTTDKIGNTTSTINLFTAF